MKIRRVQWLALAAGTLFGLGLVVSGMTNPRKVLGFLDVAGEWDASLLFVMAGAVCVHFWAYRRIAGRSAPWFAERFFVPTRKDIDVPLCVGAGVFGVGWGLSGYCPGPAVVALGSGHVSVIAFVAAMLLGTWLMRQIRSPRGISPDKSADAVERA